MKSFLVIVSLICLYLSGAAAQRNRIQLEKIQHDRLSLKAQREAEGMQCELIGVSQLNCWNPKFMAISRHPDGGYTTRVREDAIPDLSRRVREYSQHRR
jgi:hypothetical protein